MSSDRSNSQVQLPSCGNLEPLTRPRAQGSYIRCLISRPRSNRYREQRSPHWHVGRTRFLVAVSLKQPRNREGEKAIPHSRFRAFCSTKAHVIRWARNGDLA